MQRSGITEFPYLDTIPTFTQTTSHMKTWVLPLSLLFLLSCTSDPNTGAQATEQIDSTITLKETTDTTERESPIKPGFWVNTRYEQVLLDTKSPKQAQQAVEFSGFQVAEGSGESTFIWSFHEGTPTYLHREGTKIGFSNTSDNKPEYTATFQNDTLSMGSEKFVYVESGEEFQIVEKTLFEGEYLYHGKSVQMKANGEITGLDTLTHYSPLIDYFDVGLDVDMITLGSANSLPKRFGFVFEGNTLNVYSLKCVQLENGDCMKNELDTLFLQLVKQ